MKLDSFINTMISFDGIAEDPMGSNHTPIGKEFGWDRVAWCAETVSVACKRNGFPLHEAAVINIEKRARAGDYGMGWTSIPTLGAAVCFDFGGKGNPSQMHTGVVIELQDHNRFWVQEGNSGDRCRRVLRDMKYVRGFATFPFESPTPIPVVTSMFNIKLAPNVAMIANLKHPESGGEAILLSDGGVLCFDCDFPGNVLGKDYMKPDHIPQRLEINPKYAPGNGKPWYVVVDQHEHKYGLDGF